MKRKDLESLIGVNNNEEIIHRAIFSTQYKRKIHIKHWFFTKTGFIIILICIFLYYMHWLNSWVVALILFSSLALYLRDKTLLHEREVKVLLLAHKRELIKKLEEFHLNYLKKKVEDSEIEEIIERCTKK